MRLVVHAAAAAIIALLVDLAIGALALRFTGVPRNFPPFTFLPLLSGTVGGTILASVVYCLIRAVAQNPDRLFFFVSLGVFALALGLPLRLSFTHSPRFAGVTPAAQMVLVLMHAVVAAVSVVLLTSKAAPYSVHSAR